MASPAGHRNAFQSFRLGITFNGLGFPMREHLNEPRLRQFVTPAFDEYVVPITLVILGVLFAVQRFGTGRVATVFGPVTALWFLAIGIAGL